MYTLQVRRNRKRSPRDLQNENEKRQLPWSAKPRNHPYNRCTCSIENVATIVSSINLKTNAVARSLLLFLAALHTDIHGTWLSPLHPWFPGQGCARIASPTQSPQSLQVPTDGRVVLYPSVFEGIIGSRDHFVLSNGTLRNVSILLTWRCTHVVYLHNLRKVCQYLPT